MVKNVDLIDVQSLLTNATTLQAKYDESIQIV